MKYRIILESGIAIMVPDSETMVGIVAAHHKEVIRVVREEITYVNITDTAVAK